MIGLIGGSSLLSSSLFSSYTCETIDSPHGSVKVYKSQDASVVFIQRHENGPLNSTAAYHQPRHINYPGILWTLRHLDCKSVLAFGSVASLRKDIPVGSVVVPDDYWSLHDVHYHSKGHSAHIVPGFNSELRQKVITIVKKCRPPLLKTYGTYMQTSGPRFETKSEVRTLQMFGGDVVGMTCAHEATIAKEFGLDYALICIVDNMANGIDAERQLTLGEFKQGVQGNLSMVEDIVMNIMTAFAPAVKLRDARKHVDLIVCSKYMLTMESEDVLLDHAISVVDGIIQDILPKSEMLKKYTAKEVIDLSHHTLMPGLVNCHTHAGMTMLRGFADDLGLLDWLTNYIWPAEGSKVSYNFVFDGTLLACAEMIRSGTTTFNDMYFFPEATAQNVDDIGMRAVVGMVCFEFPSPYGSSAEEYLKKGVQAMEQFQDCKRLTWSVAPHAPYTVRDETFFKVKEIADAYGLPTHIHLHEAKAEVEDSANGTHSSSKHLSDSKCRPLANLDRLGLINDRLISVHMTQLNDIEIEIIASKKASVVHCPTSNLKLAAGICRVTDLLKSGANVALGTDSSASNNSLNLWDEMKLAALLSKVQANDPVAVTAWDALRMATINGARALQLGNRIGSLVGGKAADFIAIDMKAIELVPCYNIASHLVYSSGRENVTDVWVDGQCLMRNRTLATLDENFIFELASEWKEKLMNMSRHS